MIWVEVLLWVLLAANASRVFITIPPEKQWSNETRRVASAFMVILLVLAIAQVRGR